MTKVDWAIRNNTISKEWLNKKTPALVTLDGIKDFADHTAIMEQEIAIGRGLA